MEGVSVTAYGKLVKNRGFCNEKGNRMENFYFEEEAKKSRKWIREDGMGGELE